MLAWYSSDSLFYVGGCALSQPMNSEVRILITVVWWDHGLLYGARSATTSGETSLVDGFQGAVKILGAYEKARLLHRKKRRAYTYRLHLGRRLCGEDGLSRSNDRRSSLLPPNVCPTSPNDLQSPIQTRLPNLYPYRMEPPYCNYIDCITSCRGHWRRYILHVAAIGPRK